MQTNAKKDLIKNQINNYESNQNGQIIDCSGYFLFFFKKIEIFQNK